MTEIEYVQVPVRVKPHKEYLDMEGLDALWIQIKEYVALHGGENGSVNESEVNALIAAYYAAHRDELKGDPFTYADFTEEQLNALKGKDGAPGRDGVDGKNGVDGKDGIDGTVSFDKLSEAQKLELKGDKGDTGPIGPIGPIGPVGPKGADGKMSFTDLTPEQKEQLKGDVGPVGPAGPKGDAFQYSDFTEDQLNALKGPTGEPGPKGDKGDTGPQGEPGVQGRPGSQGPMGEVDYSQVYTQSQIDKMFQDLNINPDDIDLSNYYTKDQTYDKVQVDKLISELVIEGAAGVHIGAEPPTTPGVSVWVDTDGVPYDGTVDLSTTYYDKKYIDNIIETHKHRLSEMENDIGFITANDTEIPVKLSQFINDTNFVSSTEVYKKSETYDQTTVNNKLAECVKKTDDVPGYHVHPNKTILDELSEVDGKLKYKGSDIGSNGSIDATLAEYAKTSVVNAQIQNATNAINTDLTTNYAKKTDVDNKFKDYTTTTAMTGLLNQKADKTHSHSEYKITYDTASTSIKQGSVNVTDTLRTGKFLQYELVSVAPAPEAQKEGVLYIVTQ